MNAKQYIGTGLLRQSVAVDRHPTCHSHGSAVDAAPEPQALAEGGRPVGLTVAVLLVVAHLGTQHQHSSRQGSPTAADAGAHSVV